MKAIKKAKLGYLVATIHGLIPKIENLEPGKLDQSLLRYNILKDKFCVNGKVSVGGLKELITTEFPKGLSIFNYKENFGTVHLVLSAFGQKTPTSRNVLGCSPVSKWEMNVGWR